MDAVVVARGARARFRNRPALAPELLERALGVEVPPFAEARIEESVLTDLQPAEYRADLVVLLRDGVPVLAIVVEVQLRRDARKKFTWPMYVAGLRARFECPACLLVVTVDDRVAAWARRPIEIGPGWVASPRVVGPTAVPVVASPEDARRDPELAVLSAMSHGRRANDQVMIAAVAAVSAVHEVNRDRAMLYFDLVRKQLGAAARGAFEEVMKSLIYEYREANILKGEARGKQQSILRVLRARGVAISAADDARIRACTDSDVLDRWLDRAVSADSAAALFQ